MREGATSSASQYTRPFPDLRDPNASVRQPAHRNLVQPRSRVQAGAESVAAPLVGYDAANVEVLTNLQPMNAIRDLAVPPRLLDTRTKISVSQSDAALVAARGVDNLPRRGGNVVHNFWSSPAEGR